LLTQGEGGTSPDGQRLLVVKRTRPIVTSRIEIVANWPHLLERGAK
jgi:hypothetical protein